jgi:tRNA(fMet)-specific endonuclease VapC
MKYMLDTNICIYIIKEKPKQVLEKFKSIAFGNICISSITLSELAYGAEKSRHVEKNYNALNKFILPLEILTYDDPAALHYADIRHKLEKNGTPIGSMDMLIAGHARSLDLTLVTNNKKEFTRVEKLIIENWV